MSGTPVTGVRSLTTHVLRSVPSIASLGRQASVPTGQPRAGGHVPCSLFVTSSHWMVTRAAVLSAACPATGRTRRVCGKMGTFTTRAHHPSCCSDPAALLQSQVPSAGPQAYDGRPARIPTAGSRTVRQLSRARLGHCSVETRLRCSARICAGALAPRVRAFAQHVDGRLKATLPAL